MRLGLAFVISAAALAQVSQQRQSTHAIPPTVRLGASLPLVPLARAPRGSDEMPLDVFRGIFR